MGSRNSAVAHGTQPDRAPSVVETLASKVLHDVPALTDRLVREISEHNPGYAAPGVVPYQDLWRSCHDNLVRVLQILVQHDSSLHGDPPEDLYDAARETGARRARQDLPLEDVLRSFRLGGRLVWQALLEEARTQGLAEAEEMLELGIRMWSAVDRSSAQMSAAYQAAEREVRRAEEQRRTALWEGLLSGRAEDPTFAGEVAREIGVPVEGRFAVVVAPRCDQAEVERRIGDRLGSLGVAAAWEPRPDGLVGLLALRDCPLRRAVRVLGDRIGVPAGVSLVVHTLAEVRDAFAQAAVVLRTVDPSSPEVATLEQRLPDALLLSRPDLAQRLVDGWLGALLALPDGEREPLLETLETWVATDGSTTRTAESLPCHRNTVINRMRRIHAVTGQDLASGHVPLEVALAVRARRLLDRG